MSLAFPPRYDPIGTEKAGGFGKVIFCNDMNLGREVAIKVIQDPAESSRHLDEIRALLSVTSKHVVEVFDLVAFSDGTIGIVEEFIDGHDLSELKRPISSDNLLKLAWQIAAGLSDIHEAGFVHRDIKPNNIRLDAEGVVKILDFGLSRLDDGDAKTVGFVGTRGFAAPEQYSDSTVALGRAIDVYAFGVTVYFLGKGKLLKELRAMPPEKAPAQLFSNSEFDLPSELQILLESCLKHDPGERPSMPHVRDALAVKLLTNKHRALLIYSGKPNYLDKDNRSVSLSVKGVGSITISYDGDNFFVENPEGELFINNMAVSTGMGMPGSCVIAFGNSDRKVRNFVTFDISYPEVVI
jgi:eukaryotic-like serine/threonine-protein kinase